MKRSGEYIKGQSGRNRFLEKNASPWDDRILGISRALEQDFALTKGLDQPFRITDTQRVGPNGQDVSLTFNSIAGGKYAIQSSPDFQTWQTVKTNIQATSPSTIGTVPGAGTNTQNFFRLGVDPIH